MPLLLALGIVAALIFWEKRAHGGWNPFEPGLAPARPPGMPPETYWPAAPPGPGSLAAAPGPATCSSSQWHVPAQQDIPKEVTARAVEILHSPVPLGAQTVERVAGRVWRFQVEIHGANDQNPKPHRGVGVRLCL